VSASHDEPTGGGPPSNVRELLHRIALHEFWYHTIDVVPGVTTPGWFDLRHALDVMPFPDVVGKRCLDIGTFDGFFAFEMERRGAAEVVAIDLEDHDAWDWPADVRDAPSDDRFVAFRGPPKGAGFRLIAETIGSQVDWRPLSAYNVSSTELGRFDVVVCGSLMLHLRDPVRALEAIRTVCAGVLVSSEQIELALTLLGRGRPLFRLNGSGQDCQWWLPNAAGHRRLLYAAGFDITHASRPYVARFNAHPNPRSSPRQVARRLVVRALTGTWDQGVLHRALLARPRW
jgi:tRNA (mo5U34)-methyltransferase